MQNYNKEIIFVKFFLKFYEMVILVEFLKASKIVRHCEKVFRRSNRRYLSSRHSIFALATSRKSRSSQ